MWRGCWGRYCERSGPGRPEVAKVAGEDARVGAGGSGEALKRFVRGLATEGEGGVVHGEHVAAGLGLAGEHAVGLLGSSVGVFPGVVGADAEDGEVG